MGDSIRITYGVNELYGRANLSSRQFSYAVPLDGRTPPDSVNLPTDETTFLTDRRSFFGLYAQARWLLAPDLSFLGGLRWNRTTESRSAGGDEAASVTDRTDITRLSGSLGTNWRLWKDPTSDLNALSAYLDFGNTFQPPQIDLGPERAAGPLLHPETERSIEFGLKGDSLEGHLDVDVSAFVVDFNNQTITTQIGGFPTLAAGGRERFKGVEIEGHYRPSERLTVRANYSYNDARYRDFNTVIDGSLVQLAGNRLPLSPQDLAALGVTYGGTQGFQGALTLNYVGRRYLDMQNTVPAKAFMTADGSFGYRFRDWTVSMNIYNLRNRRDPVLASELGEHQIYRLTGRRAFMTLSVTLR